MIVRDRCELAGGYNGLPRGIADTPARLSVRELKYDLVVHAELNAMLNAGRHGVPLLGSTLYCSFPPCIRCAVDIIQAGIVRVVTPADAEILPHHAEALRLDLARDILVEAGVAIDLL